MIRDIEHFALSVSNMEYFLKFFMEQYVSKYPERFLAYTMSDFAMWEDFMLFREDNFVDMAIQHLEEDIKKGACGLKVTKELGLHFKDRDGSFILIDDEHLYLPDNVLKKIYFQNASKIIPGIK